MIINKVYIELKDLIKGIDFKYSQNITINNVNNEKIIEMCYFRYNKGVLYSKRKGICIDGEIREKTENRDISLKELEKMFLKKYGIIIKR